MGAADRYSAKNMAKPVNFYCVAPEAREVVIVGDFNSWTAGVHRLERRPDGSWYIQLPLTHGHHHYRFVVDGQPVLDPRATGVARNEKNERVSLISIS
jgi:1,4-alpha-glucan branching enzyme